jgi:hypothetical protein
MARGNERMRERFERPRLDEVRLPGLEIRLRVQPSVENGIGVIRQDCSASREEHQREAS